MSRGALRGKKVVEQLLGSSHSGKQLSRSGSLGEARREPPRGSRSSIQGDQHSSSGRGSSTRRQQQEPQTKARGLQPQIERV
jgi:hypothetical protein